MGRFIAFSIGLLVSVLGSAFTGLGMGVWVFQHTGSATQYSFTLLLNLLPAVIFGPLAGALVDRWNRRVILIVTEVGSAITVVGLMLLFDSGMLQPWHVFIAVSIQSLIRAVQMPALSAVVVLLAPKEHLARANGVVMLAQALGNTVGFAAGGVIFLTIDLDGVLLVDFATFLVNIAILMFVHIPPTPRTDASAEASGGLLAEIRAGWRVFGTRRALITVLIFSAALNVSLGYADAILTPMVLSFASAAALGLVVASMGVGAVLGSLLLAAWGGPRRRVNGLAGFAIPLGLFLCLGAVRPNIPMMLIAALGFTFCFTIVDGTTRNILQLEVEPDVQGRVFATYNMVASAVVATSYLLAGTIADGIFEPLLLVDGPLAGSVGSVIGTGPGRGMALLMLVIGLITLVTSVAAYRQSSLRRLADRPTTKESAEPAADDELPVPTGALAVPVSDDADATDPDRRTHPVRAARGGSDDMS